MADVRCVLDAGAVLGESPVWSAEEQALYWVDILAPTVNRFDCATGRNQSWPLPEAVGSCGLRESGGAVLALRNGFHLFDFESRRLTFLTDPETDRPENRFNDGKVSPEGRFWAGTMDEAEMRRPTGALYRLDADGRCQKMMEDLIVSNGLAWSADGRTLLHSDSRRAEICAYDYDADTGDIGNRRIVATPDEAVGRPDGGAMDMEGYYWSAGVSSGFVNRWALDGTLDRQIPLPCAAPTCPCFGGPDLKTLYVTSLRDGVSAERLADTPLSGGIFAIDVDVPGVPVARFKG